jgi:hypothetical protein
MIEESTAAKFAHKLSCSLSGFISFINTNNFASNIPRTNSKETYLKYDLLEAYALKVNFLFKK